jgi:hypothetical protein
MKIIKSNLPTKRFVAVYCDGSRVQFGQRGATTFVDGATEETRKNWIARHKVRSDFNDPYSAGSLAKHILWGESKSIDANVRAFNRKFFPRCKC